MIGNLARLVFPSSYGSGSSMSSHLIPVVAEHLCTLPVPEYFCTPCHMMLSNDSMSFVSANAP